MCVCVCVVCGVCACVCVCACVWCVCACVCMREYSVQCSCVVACECCVKPVLVQTFIAGHSRARGDSESVETENTHHEILHRDAGTTEN